MPALPFYLLSAITAGCAIGAVALRNTVTAAFCLLGSLLGMSGLFVLLDAYLLAALLVLVYAGAIVALFVFIVMLLDVRGSDSRPTTRV
ncbi:MAG TPA: NADH-quinone oxidoreductase subunit J, partial [Opitutaceae bacterium]|nr:NADH-quinone oxidoreductase subunit J [Opitutaceae bacterium]